MLTSLSSIWSRFRSWLSSLWPTPLAFAGAGTSLKWTAWGVLAAVYLVTVLRDFSIYSAVGTTVLLGLILAIVAAVRGSTNLIRDADANFLKGLGWFSVVAFLLIVAYPDGVAGWVAAGLLALAAGLLGGGWAVRRRDGMRWTSALAIGVGGVGLAFWLISAVLERWPTEETLSVQWQQAAPLAMPDPSEPGDFEFDVVFYGSGDNPVRPEFGDEVDVVSETVDGSKLIDGWSGRSGWARTNYWNATAETLPVNGKAWVPRGDGPFPVVLIVHGNHSMEDFSDTGYDYLGELFASQGVLAVSVDQNFLNSSNGNLAGIPDGGLEKENDARGWLLLKHLEQFRNWSGTPDHPMAGKADLDRVVLIGHSRGGEAVSEAAAFNTLPAYPDDALLDFDFGFGIKGLIAIAPVDRQYHPRGGDTRFSDVSYLVIHGSHDGDVTSYSGYATYSRADFPTCAECFKAGVYLLGANHGQFNTSWGDSDLPAPFGLWLNRAHLISGEDQRAVAKVLFSAFLRATLFDDEGYVPVLAEPARAKAWLPETTQLLNQFGSARELTVADYFEDADVSTASLPGVAIAAEGLALWREQLIELKWHGSDSAAVVLGWHEEEAASNAAARYQLEFVAGTLPELTDSASLALSLAALSETPGELEDFEAPETVDFSIELTDRSGVTASLPLSTRGEVVKMIDPKVHKLHALHSERTEIVFQRFAFALSEWLAVEPRLDPGNLASIDLVFDKTPAATIALERVTLSP